MRFLLLLYVNGYADLATNGLRSGVWAGVDNAWGQEKLEARKKPKNAADSHTSGARVVGRHLWVRLIVLLNKFYLLYN
jgi:hypothetical protein